MALVGAFAVILKTDCGIDGSFYSTSSGSMKKEKKEPPKYPCHMCDIPVMFALTALRRHLARKHSTNFKCTKVGAEDLFVGAFSVIIKFSRTFG